MASHPSAAKRARQNANRNVLNRARRSRVHTFATVVEKALTGGTIDQAKTALRTAESAIAKAVSQKILHWRTAARKTSRLAKKVAAKSTGAKG